MNGSFFGPLQLQGGWFNMAEGEGVTVESVWLSRAMKAMSLRDADQAKILVLESRQRRQAWAPMLDVELLALDSQIRELSEQLAKATATAATSSASSSTLSAEATTATPESSASATSIASVTSTDSATSIATVTSTASATSIATVRRIASSSSIVSAISTASATSTATVTSIATVTAEAVTVEVDAATTASVNDIKSSTEVDACHQQMDKGDNVSNGQKDLQIVQYLNPADRETLRNQMMMEKWLLRRCLPLRRYIPDEISLDSESTLTSYVNVTHTEEYLRGKCVKMATVESADEKIATRKTMGKRFRAFFRRIGRTLCRCCCGCRSKPELE